MRHIASVGKVRPGDARHKAYIISLASAKKIDMRCYKHKTAEGAKIAIPHCMPVANSGDIRDCICPKPVKPGKMISAVDIEQIEMILSIDERRVDVAHILQYMQKLYDFYKKIS